MALKKLLHEDIILSPNLGSSQWLYSYGPIEYAYLDVTGASLSLIVAGNEELVLTVRTWIEENRMVLAEQLVVHMKMFNMLLTYVGRIVVSEKSLQSYETSPCILTALMAGIAKDTFDYFAHQVHELQTATETAFPQAFLAAHNHFANFLYAACAALKPLVVYLATLKCPFNPVDFFLSVYRAAVISQEADGITSVILTQLSCLLEISAQNPESAQSPAFTTRAAECKALISILVDVSINSSSVSLLGTNSVKLGVCYEQFERALLAKFKDHWLFPSGVDLQATGKSCCTQEVIFTLQRMCLPSTVAKIMALGQHLSPLVKQGAF